MAAAGNRRRNASSNRGDVHVTYGDCSAGCREVPDEQSHPEPSCGSNRSLARRALSFGRRKDGATVIEFGFLLPPFLLLLFATIQTAVVFYAGQVLETATADAARLIMTGQAQEGFNGASVRDQLGACLDALFNCATGVKIDVRKYAWASGTVSIAYPNANLQAPLDEDGNLDTDDFAYSAGYPGRYDRDSGGLWWPTFVAVSDLILPRLRTASGL